MRDFHSSFDKSDLVDCLDVWGKATMDAEYLSFDNGSDSKVIKYFCAVLPGVSITILSDSFIVKAVNCSNLSSLVITSKEGNVSWIFKF